MNVWSPLSSLPIMNFLVKLLSTHATIAKILHATGTTETIETMFRDREELRFLAADGSTDLEQLFITGVLTEMIDLRSIAALLLYVALSPLPDSRTWNSLHSEAKFHILQVEGRHATFRNFLLRIGHLNDSMGTQAGMASVLQLWGEIAYLPTISRSEQKAPGQAMPSRAE
ncbi:hypothetical protein AJ78_01227 [Emergomyces pasteurianus Ep9510]|uniref:Uncharacterized protein n=1 Tax=Emergomyces pasteurianus Ep9510 TaxID=1447872 RepID=A0A1J9QS97_9EURO|nr:hypothetical protein AJ78_01227 [Emergomyces pasteurianus Ep9510]